MTSVRLTCRALGRSRRSGLTSSFDVKEGGASGINPLLTLRRHSCAARDVLRRCDNHTSGACLRGMEAGDFRFGVESAGSEGRNPLSPELLKP